MGGGAWGWVFVFNDTATTEIYTLSLHDALPICVISGCAAEGTMPSRTSPHSWPASARSVSCRSEEHTSELQSHLNLVCRLLLEKKKQPHTHHQHHSCRRLHQLLPTPSTSLPPPP